MSNDIFCVAPFVNLSTMNAGGVRLCCQSKTLDGLHLNNNSIDEIWSSNQYQDVREKFLNNAWPTECDTCKHLEEKGMTSRRHFENHNWTSKTGTAFPNTALEFPWSLDIRLGNICNLKCVMCGPTNSNTWYDENEQFEHLKYFKKDENVRWPYHESFLDNYTEWAHKVKIFYFSGGEPLLLKKHAELIKFLVSTGAAKNKILYYDTNATYIDENWIDLWKNFQEVNLNLSIDGGKAVNEYIRYPVDHQKILEKYNILSNAPASIICRLQLSLGALNIFEIDTIKSYINQYGFKAINISIVYWPDFMTLQSLPQDVIDVVSEKYKNDENSRIRNMTRDLRHDVEKSHNLKTYLNKIDAIRGLDHKTVFQYLYD